jgi:excinuclease UvrABC nuclease subunit
MRLQKLDRNTLKEVPRSPITYVLYDSHGVPIYHGCSGDGRHRLQSYIERDDFNAHPTKMFTAQHAKFFTWLPARNKAHALRRDRDAKKDYVFNFR